MLIDDAEQVAVLSACRRPRQRAHEAQYLVGFLPETHLADILSVEGGYPKGFRSVPPT